MLTQSSSPRGKFRIEFLHSQIGKPAMPVSLPIAKNMTAKPATTLEMLAGLVNRHGCITGATGTGKTVTLQTIAQALSNIGVPVFMADVKGDLSGLSQPGAASPKMEERLKM